MDPALLLAVSGELPLDHHDYSLISLAVVAVFLVVAAAAGTWAVVRRRPPIEVEIDNRIDTKLRSVVDHWNERHATLHDEMLRLNQERRVTVAGLFQKLEDYRKETKDDMGQLTQSMQNGFRDLSHSIGLLEGERKGRS